MSRNNADEAISLLDDDLDEPSSKRQKTLSKVCETCRLKKSKCDNGRPQCSSCRRKGVACLYREKGQPGLRPGYGKAMEARMERLEANMEEISSSIQRFIKHLSPTDTQKAPELPNDQRYLEAGPGVGEQHVPENPIHSSNNGFGLWQTPPMAPVDSSVADEVPPLGNGYLSTPTIDATPAISSHLPPLQVLTRLVDLFFDLVYPWFPLFHKRTFVQELHNPRRQLLLHGIVATCFRFWTGDESDASQRERYVAQSRQHILLHAIDRCTLISTQALVLLALDALGQGTGPRAWNTMNLLATAARHLGIATNPALSNAVTESNTPLVRNDDDDVSIFPSIIEAEERVRLFWVFCSLDRFSSVVHGVPGGIPTRTIRMAYPKNESDWEIETPSAQFNGVIRFNESGAGDSSSLWHQYCDLMALADRCNQLLIQPVNLFDLSQCQHWQSSFRDLDNTLAAWQTSLPNVISTAPSTFEPMWCLLHANFHLIKIRMYTVAGFPSTTSPHVRPSTSARTRCRSAVKDVASLSKGLHPLDFERLGPIFAFVTWVAARSLIILWTSGHVTYESIAGDMETLLNTLRQLGRYWQSAVRYSDLIQLVLDTKDSPGGQSHLDIFSDTRRTAYGLEKCLGSLAERGNVDIQPTSFDFLDMPFLDAGDSSNGWYSNFRLDGNGELF